MCIVIPMVIPTRIRLRISQAIFAIGTTYCFGSVASFQAKWDVGPTSLTGIALFVSAMSLIISSFMLVVPEAYERDELGRLGKVLEDPRVPFILDGSGTLGNLALGIVTSISAWTQPGCKNPANDPHAADRDQGFQDGLSNWCVTKQIGAVIFCTTTVLWATSLWFSGKAWRKGAGDIDPESVYNHPR